MKTNKKANILFQVMIKYHYVINTWCTMKESCHREYLVGVWETCRLGHSEKHFIGSGIKVKIQ